MSSPYDGTPSSEPNPKAGRGDLESKIPPSPYISPNAAKVAAAGRALNNAAKAASRATKGGS